MRLDSEAAPANRREELLHVEHDAQDAKDFEIKKPASMSDYNDLIDDRPRKFNAEASGYREAKKGEPTCDQCLHFYTMKITRWTVSLCCLSSGRMQ